LGYVGLVSGAACNPNEDAIRRAAEKLNIPADVITPVDGIDPGIFA
jgi:hypothetical protein